MTNVVMNVVVLVLVLAVSAGVLRRMRRSGDVGPVLVSVLVLCVLTTVFDTVMIAADLYVFDPSKILGWYVWGAPVEDFFYAVVAAVGMPVLWTWLGERDARRPRDSAGQVLRRRGRGWRRWLLLVDRQNGPGGQH